MRPAQVVKRAAAYLEHHGVDSPVPTAERLLSHVLGTDRAGVYAREGLTSQEAKLFGRALCRRCAGEPLQHVTGEQGFRRIVLRVRPGVFVPRPETEVLVQTAMDELASVTAPVVVDVATGSGAVALAIADERPDASVFATDLSAEAVALARENAEALGADVSVFEGDLLDGLPPELRGRLDAVTCNPPYVAEEARGALPADVLAEPPLAVFGGIEIYERLFTQAAEWLAPGGLVAVEIEESTADLVSKAAGQAGFEAIAVRRDLTGRDRVMAGRRPPEPRDHDRMTLAGPLGDAAAAALRSELIVFPTDTVYGLGTRPDDPAATARVFEAKHRPRDLELPVLVATVGAAHAVAVFDDRADRLAAAAWPGPLTLVLPRGADASGWDLGGDPTTVGVRAPHHPLALAILAETGPLAVTSANRSGAPPAETCDELRALFGEDVAVYLCQGDRLEGVASTVVDLAHGPASILREGSLQASAIAELLPEEPSLLDSRPSS